MVEIIDWYGSNPKIAIAADHGGFAQKQELAAFLEGRGISVVDCGPFSFDAGDDYSDFGIPAARAVMLGECGAAILLCRSGVGMGMAANRFHNVRAAVAADAETAKRSREHNCSNVLVLPGDKLDFAAMKPVVEAWLSTPFSKDERHLRRLSKLEIGSYDDFSASKNSIALSINGCVTKGAGSLTLVDGAFPVIAAEKNLAIRYKAKVSASEAVTNVNAATIVFTIAAVSEKEAA